MVKKAVIVITVFGAVITSARCSAFVLGGSVVEVCTGGIWVSGTLSDCAELRTGYPFG